jgi:hypothetical protein
MTWVKVLASFVAIAVAAGAAWWFWLGPGTLPPTSACPAAERADIAESDVAFQPTIAWQPAELPAFATDGDEQIMLAVSALEDGWVAAGRTSTGPTSHGFLLRSIDDGTWHPGPDDAIAFAEAEIGLIVEFSRRAVAAGSVWTGDVRTGVWVNRGAPAWQEGSGPFQRSHPTALGAGGRSLLLLGAADSGGVPLAWTSDEGSIWERLDLRLPVDPNLVSFSSVRASDDGWLAVGSLSRGVDQPTWPVAWASRDGATWTCLLLDRAGFDAVTPTALHRSAQGWLAIGIGADLCGFGASCPGYTIAWTSPDGVRWSAGITEVEPWHTGGIAVAGSAEGFVAIGHGATWWSADGNAWVEVADGGSGAQALIGQPDAIFMTDGGQLAAVGTTYDGTDPDAWIATGVLQR